MKIFKGISSDRILRILIYLCIFFSTFNASFLAINLFGFSISLFRILLILTLPIVLLKIRKEIFSLNKKVLPYFIFMFVWFCYALVSYLWIYDTFEWFQTLYFLWLGLLSIYLFSKIVTKEFFVKCLMSFSLASIVHIVIGAFEYSTGKYLFILDDYYLQYLHNKWPVSTFTNTNNYAFFLSLSVCIFIFLVKYSKDNIIKIIYLTSTIFAVLLICATESRGVVLALIIGTSILLLNKYVFYNYKKQFNIIVYICCSTFLILLITFVLIGKMNLDFFQNPNNSNTIRLNLTINSFQFLIDSNYLGVGAGNFEYWINNFALLPTNGIMNAHNWFLEILSEYGIFIFIGYIGFIVKLYIESQRESNNEFNESFRFLLIFFLVVFCIGSISPSSILEMEWLWILFGVLISGICGENNENINYN